MGRLLILRVAGLALLCMACTAAFGQAFSADMVDTEGKEAKTNAKIYVDSDHMRVESEGEEGHSGIMVMNYSTGVMDIIMPQQHMYMESKADQGAGRNMRIFQIYNVENACPDWQRIQKENGTTATCRRVGDETLRGRSTVKYVGTSSDGKTSTVWIDKSLRFPIQWQEEDNTGSLENIHEGPQPASLFAIPPGYQKMDLGNMMRGQHH